MFSRFTFENFKSFKHSELPIEPVTLIIGANGSGKSNALEGMQIIARLGTPLKIQDILDGIRGQFHGIRGGSKGAALTGEQYFRLGCSWIADESRELEYNIEVQTQPTIQIRTESLEIHNYALSQSAGDNVDQVCHTGDIDQAGDTNQIGYTDHSGFINQSGCTNQTDDIDQPDHIDHNGIHTKRLWKTVDPNMGGREKAKLLTQWKNLLPVDKYTTSLVTPLSTRVNDPMQHEFVQSLGEIFFLHPVPHLMKDYVSIYKTELLPNAENLSAVMAELLREPETKETILELLQDFPEQQIVDIDVLVTPTDEVMLKLVERIGSREATFDIRGLSDGTLQVLAIIAALLSEPAGTTLVIEEIENGLHPSRIGKLMNFISDIARARQIDVVITTHNPALLNALPTDDLAGIVICYRDRQEGYSHFVRLIDLPAYPELMAVAAGQIGNLLTQGLIEKATKETEDERRRKTEQALRWVEEELE